MIYLQTISRVQSWFSFARFTKKKKKNGTERMSSGTRQRSSSDIRIRIQRVNTMLVPDSLWINSYEFNKSRSIFRLTSMNSGRRCGLRARKKLLLASEIRSPMNRNCYVGAEKVTKPKPLNLITHPLRLSVSKASLPTLSDTRESTGAICYTH